MVGAVHRPRQFLLRIGDTRADVCAGNIILRAGEISTVFHSGADLVLPADAVVDKNSQGFDAVKIRRDIRVADRVQLFFKL